MRGRVRGTGLSASEPDRRMKASALGVPAALELGLWVTWVSVKKTGSREAPRVDSRLLVDVVTSMTAFPSCPSSSPLCLPLLSRTLLSLPPPSPTADVRGQGTPFWALLASAPRGLQVATPRPCPVGEGPCSQH